MNITRAEAEKQLQQIFGIEHFYDEQWTAIDSILHGNRILMIQRTGFGKSLCYQFPATLFPCVTVVISPLISLMRDQVKNLNAKGIAARYINSEQSPEENTQSINDALNGKIKILYIAPERLENEEWKTASRIMKFSMVVIDEAHCISVWGHDFRTDYRRINNLVKLLPQHMPILSATATATKRVQKDIEQQIEGNLTTIRGDLRRPNFNLYVLKVHSEDEKMIWLAQNLSRIEGTGLIYTGTRVNTEIYAKWLKFIGINSIDYNAGLDANTRKEIENNLMANKYKCVVSTNALGMGIDKSDIRFIIHTQIPISPIHYYQEIGRAGRDGKPTTIILFFNEQKDKDGIAEDYKLPKAFIDGGRPAIKSYDRVIERLKEEPLGERSLMKLCNLKQTQIRVIKADLIEQGIIKEVLYGKNKKYEYQFNAKPLNTSSFEELRKAKLKDLDAMVEYVYTNKPRMQYLCEFLDNETTMKYENCDNTNLKPFNVVKSDIWQNKLTEFRETYFPILEVESKGSNLINGVAASYYGVSNVGNAIHRSKYENGGDFPDFLLRLTLKAFRKTFGNQKFDLILYVPPTHSGDLVKNFAAKISKTLNVPISHTLIKTRETQEQKVFQNGYSKKDNIANAFGCINMSEIQGKRIILLDDIFDSGATIKEIGKMLTQNGAQVIAPITIAKTIGGELV